MIAEFVKKSDGNNRGQSPALVKYIFGVTKDNDKIDPEKKHEHTGLKEKIHFIGCSKNLCIVDPLMAMKNGKLEKLDGSEANLDEIINQFVERESKNERAKFPLEHVILSPERGEELTIDQWHEAIEMYTKKMGYDNCTWASTLHEDTLTTHAHIAICNISNEPPHNSVNPSNKFQLSAEARTEIEQKFGLNHTVNPFEDKIQVKDIRLEKNQIPNHIRKSIDEIMSKNKSISVPDFQEEMMKRNIGTFASFKFHETEIQGLSFSYGTHKVIASKLGKGYKTKDLMANGLNYDMHRDLDRVNRLNELEKDRMSQIEAIESEIENFTEKFIDKHLEKNEVSRTFKVVGHDPLQSIMNKFCSEFYVVSMMDQQDKESTYQNKQTRTYDCIGEALKQNDGGSSKLCSIAIDPNDKYGKQAIKKLANLALSEVEARVKKSSQKMLNAWLKVLILSLYSGKASNYKKNHMLPKRGYDMGLLNERLDKSPLLILDRREMALMLSENKTLRIIKDNEHNCETYITLNKDKKVLFTHRREGGIKHFPNDFTMGYRR
ncbi:MAG: relaxase/mobilization nuclease domain-containing protein [Colwellia sp.]